MKLGIAQIIQGNALALPLPDSSVDLVVTSPPYFGLRSYQDAGEHYDGQIGSEATPAEFLDALLAATREMVRVLKPSGSIFVNLGDKYAQDTERSRNGLGDRNEIRNMCKAVIAEETVELGRRNNGVLRKSLIGIPWRYAIRCIDELGLILRAEIIWAKPNGLPESVTDRVRRSHEQWFHFTKQPRYFSAIDEIREEHVYPADIGRARSGYAGAGAPGQSPPGNVNGGNPLGKLPGSVWTTDEGETWIKIPTPNTANAQNAKKLGLQQNEHGTGQPEPGSVWTIPTQPLTVPPELGVDHFAAYPMEWPRRIIQGWTPNGICAECGFLLGSSYDSGMLGVQRGFQRTRAQREASEVLQQEMRQSPYSEEPSINQIPQADNSWLRGGLSAGPPDGSEEWLSNGAPLSDGEPHRETAGTVRSGTPHQRNQDGQPDRESRTTRQGGPRQIAEASTQAVRLPSLRRAHANVRDSQPCPHCGSDSLQPSVIVDSFGGTGTTALVAKALGRTGITIDLSKDYCRLAEWRCNDPRELAAALQVEKPDPVHPDQLDLFSGIE